MFGLYEPHNLETGVAAFGPSSTVVPARARATAWASAGRQTAMAAGRAGGSGSLHSLSQRGEDVALSQLCERRASLRDVLQARMWRPSHSGKGQARALPANGFASN